MRSRLYEVERLRKQEEESSYRKSQVGSEIDLKELEHNFPQGRVSDHRINLTLYKLDQFLTGEALDEMIAALSASEQAEKLSQLNVNNIYNKTDTKKLLLKKLNNVNGIQAEQESQIIITYAANRENYYDVKDNEINNEMIKGTKWKN